MPRFKRVTYTRSDVRAGCFDCEGSSQARWFGKNAQGVAARHTDATGHHTWVDVVLEISYTGRDDAGGGER